MTAINEKRGHQPSLMGDTEGMDRMRDANSMLSETIAKQEIKNNELIAKNQKLKAFSKCFKHSMASQCKFCHSFYPTEAFLEHVKSCSKDMNNFNRSHFF
jgi:aerobic-type carbon monoxide dehydrogenase small subunit (CoxS/CutS family)